MRAHGTGKTGCLHRMIQGRFKGYQRARSPGWLKKGKK